MFLRQNVLQTPVAGERPDMIVRKSSPFQGGKNDSYWPLFWNPQWRGFRDLSDYVKSQEYLQNIFWHFCSWNLRWLIKGKHILSTSLPIGSMGLVYLPTWMVDVYGKCRQIYQSDGSYGLYFLDIWLPKSTNIDLFCPNCWGSRFFSVPGQVPWNFENLALCTDKSFFRKDQRPVVVAFRILSADWAEFLLPNFLGKISKKLPRAWQPGIFVVFVPSAMEKYRHKLFQHHCCFVSPSGVAFQWWRSWTKNPRATRIYCDLWLNINLSQWPNPW